ncbi:MAG: NUDIX domain-containing protein [Candidatus Diapherotrites archaeon]|nr:NUDIX domain-containing protein [Candidatus Diapherotrites archaeon]
MDNVIVVDKADKEVGVKPRSEAHADGAWHRGVHVLILNENNELLLQKRGRSKDTFPNCWDFSISEHVNPGESYEEAAIRGLKEELGIVGATLEEKGHLRMNYGDADNMITKLFITSYGQFPPRINLDELAAVRFMPLGDVDRMLARKPGAFTKYFHEIYTWWRGRESEAEVIE